MIPNFDLAKFNQQINTWLALIAQAEQEPMGADPRQLCPRRRFPARYARPHE